MMNRMYLRLTLNLGKLAERLYLHYSYFGSVLFQIADLQYLEYDLVI